MLFEKKNQLVLYLEDWQMRMVKDFCGRTCHRLILPIDGEPRPKYNGPPPPGEPPSGNKKMYLSEWQRREIAHEMGEQCEFIELSEAIFPHVRYGAPIPQ